ncbi:TPA: cell filamentation protein Fic, partial [Bacillus anthracis]|nr:cell filamentation protein Fic [Bacillus anthracis]
MKRILHTPLDKDTVERLRIWLDLIFKNELHQVVDWNKIDKEDYLLAMERSPIKDIEIKHLLQNALVDEINSREIFMKGINMSYY